MWKYTNVKCWQWQRDLVFNWLKQILSGRAKEVLYKLFNKELLGNIDISIIWRARVLPKLTNGSNQTCCQ